MSTTHRIDIPAPVRHGFAAVQAVSPRVAARVAERLFFTPPRRNHGAALEALLNTGHPFTVRAGGRRVMGWRWAGTDRPIVYLAHGWGSRGGRLGAFAAPLVAAGYAVVTWDAPGHGASGAGMSSMPEFARAMAAVVERQGPAYAVIGHSMGASAAALAASWGLIAERYAFLAPAADPSAFAESFSSALGVRPAVMTRARARSERRLAFSWSDLDVCRMARAMTSPLLVVHDREDQTIPFEEGEAIAGAWPGARLIETCGLGHSAITRDPAVVTEVLRFVSGGGTRAPGGEQVELERELFEPAQRWASGTMLTN